MPDSCPVASPRDPVRRRLLGGGVFGLAGLVLACSRPGAAAATAVVAPPAKVTVVEFDNAGRRVQALRVPKLVRSEAEWKQRLSPRSYYVARQGGTERPFSGEYDGLKPKDGVFRCICCGTALFDARTKFESGTGWPSFWQPIARENIVDISDRSLGMVRIENRCVRCDAHLGHVFDDGPAPTGLRYCMNSVALKYFPATAS